MAIVLEVSMLLGPLVVLASLLAFSAPLGHNDGLADAVLFARFAALLLLVASVAALRRPGARVFAQFLALVLLAFAVYLAAALAGRTQTLSLFKWPSLIFALLGSAWTHVAISVTGERDPPRPPPATKTP